MRPYHPVRRARRRAVRRGRRGLGGLVPFAAFCWVIVEVLRGLGIHR